jgi:glutamate synthase (NADPH) large chain
MVELDPLDSSDASFLQEMIAKHYKYTNSTVAKFILDDFDNQQKHFIKVFPSDYKKVLMQKEQVVMSP